MPFNKIITEKKEKIIELCIMNKVRRLELFGSVLNENFDEDSSDLDFLVEFLPQEPIAHADCYFKLLEALQDIFNRNIDLVEIVAIQNPYFLESINQTRSLLYAA
ncbi:MAG: hypothetical protein GY754_14065 [bacterium]|nr:hypothetical protein [bacterium]